MGGASGAGCEWSNQTDEGSDWPFLQETDPPQQPHRSKVKGDGTFPLQTILSAVFTRLFESIAFDLRVRRSDDETSLRNLLVASGTAPAAVVIWTPRDGERTVKLKERTLGNIRPRRSKVFNADKKKDFRETSSCF